MGFLHSCFVASPCLLACLLAFAFVQQLCTYYEIFTFQSKHFFVYIYYRFHRFCNHFFLCCFIIVLVLVLWNIFAISQPSSCNVCVYGILSCAFLKAKQINGTNAWKLTIWHHTSDRQTKEGNFWIALSLHQFYHIFIVYPHRPTIVRARLTTTHKRTFVRLIFPYTNANQAGEDTLKSCSLTLSAQQRKFETATKTKNNQKRHKTKTKQFTIKKDTTYS